MAQQSRLTGHVRTRNHHDLLLLSVEIDIVGHIALTEWHLRLNDGMAALVNVEHVSVVHDGAHIAVVFRHLGKGEQAVDMRQNVGIDLYLRDELLHGYDEFREETGLQLQYFLIGTQYFFLVFFQLRRDIALSLRKGLLAYPSFGHLVLKGVAHFEIIAEDIVESNLQRGDASLLRLALLYLQQVVFTAA